VHQGRISKRIAAAEELEKKRIRRRSMPHFHKRRRGPRDEPIPCQRERVGNTEVRDGLHLPDIFCGGQFFLMRFERPAD